MNRFRIIVACLISFLSIQLSSIAQPILKCTEYKSGGAMDHSRVSCYVQDSKGFLWFGTWIGLCRYDGQHFQYFRLPQGSETVGGSASLGSNRIMRMVLDSQENIWCQNYDRSLYRFDRATSSFHAVLPLVKGYPAETALVDRIFALHRSNAIWVVMSDGTLIRFDERDPAVNEVFPNAAGQKNRSLYEIREDSKGREWILSDQGIYIKGIGLVSNYPYNRMVEQSGRYVLASYAAGRLVEYREDGQLVPMQLPSDIRMVNNLQAPTNGWLSVSTDQGVVLCDLANDSMHWISRDREGHPVGSVERTYFDNNNRFWFLGNESGLYCVSPFEERALCLPSPTSTASNVVENRKLNLIHQDVDGVIWAKPHDCELCWVDEQTMTLRSHKDCMPKGEELPIRDYSSCFVDHQRNLWISSGTRVYQLTFGRRQFRSATNVSGEEVRALLVEDDSRVWYADKLGNICRHDMKSGREVYLSSAGQWSDKPVRFSPDGIYCMMRDHYGYVWVGTRGSGLYRLSSAGRGYRVEHYWNQGNTYDLNCNDIYDFYEDEFGRLWIATFGGGINLVMLPDMEQLSFLHAGNEFLGYPLHVYDVVRSVQGDGHGHILAGTNKGVLAFSSRFNHISEISFSIYHAQMKQGHPLPDNMVMDVLYYPDSSCFFLSTYSRGLCQVNGLDSLSFTSLPNRDYPAGDVNISSFVASNGEVWAVAECGITCYSPKVKRMWYFDERDFDRAYPLTECRPVEMSDGTIVMGMFGGIFYFQSHDLHKSLYSPKIVFTQVQFPVGSGLEEWNLNDIDTLAVEPEQRSLSFHFAALDFINSHQIRYAYQFVEGEEDLSRWVYIDTPEVNFTNLQPGSYRLVVRSTNSDGIWRNNNRTLIIHVLPTFWERWRLLFCVLAVALSVVLFVEWYRRRMRLQQELVVRQEVSATKIKMLSRASGSEDDAFLHKLMEAVERRLVDSDMQIVDLCEEMNMSRASLYRRLKVTLDMSPVDFIHQCRMRRACELLSGTDDNISTIAYSVGFNSPKYFSKCFRQDFGVTPGQYRENVRNEGVATNSGDEDTVS